MPSTSHFRSTISRSAVLEMGTEMRQSFTVGAILTGYISLNRTSTGLVEWLWAKMQVGQPEPNSTQINSTQLNSTQLNPAQPNPAQLNPTQPNPTQINPTQPNSDEDTTHHHSETRTSPLLDLSFGGMKGIKCAQTGLLLHVGMNKLSH